ncbi:MAG: DnaA N-terminal domain-containing protein, partial [Candidatus Vogelbacteria bacterium]
MLLLDHKKLWAEALADIELNVSKANFGTWFKNTNIARQELGIVYLSVPNAFVKEWLVNKYHKFIIKSLRDLHPEIRGVEYLICKTEDSTKEKREAVFEKPAYTEQLAMQELYINKEDNLNPR